MGHFEFDAGFVLLLIATFWCLVRISRGIKSGNDVIWDANRHLVGNEPRPKPAAPVSGWFRLDLQLLRQPAWRTAVAVTSLTLICCAPASPEAHECPLRPLLLREVIEQVSQPVAVPTSPCASIPFRDARQLAERNANRVRIAPGLILAVIFYESRFAPCAVSSSGALGLMQLKPGTASEFGVENAFDPPDNVAGGTRYLRYLLDHYDGDTELALAAYKAGMRRVDRQRIRRGSIATQQYVANVMRLAVDMSAD